MGSYEFSPLYVARLSVNASFALNQSTVELAKPHVAEIGPISAAALSVLESVTQAMGNGMNKSQKSALTDEMKPLDAERDAASDEAFRVTATYLKSSDAAKKAAASAMQLFLSPYKGLARMPLDVETRVMKEMLAKYNASADLKTAALALGIDGLFEAMESKNNAFEALYKSRNEQNAVRVESGSSQKPAANNAYIQFCTAIAQAVNFTPSDTIVALFNQMDVLRKKYHALEGGSDAPAAPTADGATAQ